VQVEEDDVSLDVDKRSWWTHDKLCTLP